MYLCSLSNQGYLRSKNLQTQFHRSAWRLLRLVVRRWRLTAQMTDTNIEGVGQMRATGAGGRGDARGSTHCLCIECGPGSCMHRGALASCSACQGPWLMTCRPCSLPPLPPPHRSRCTHFANGHRHGHKHGRRGVTYESAYMWNKSNFPPTKYHFSRLRVISGARAMIS